DDVGAGEAGMIHQRGGVVSEGGDAVADVRFIAEAGTALIEGQDAILLRERRGEAAEHGLIALGAVDENDRNAAPVEIVCELNAVDGGVLHTNPLQQFESYL